MSNDVAWEDCDGQIAGKIIRVYDLRQERVRIDSTTVSGHWEEGELFAFGKSKDNRPDLVQVKVNIATLDPLGIPVSTTVVSGSKADDPLYVPEIQKVQKSVQEKDLLYVGDCKMSSLDTRSYIVRSGNHYLSPLSQVQMPRPVLKELLNPVFQGQQPLELVYTPKSGDQPVAEGFTLERTQVQQEGEQAFEWQESYLVLHSFKFAEGQQRQLDQRLD